MFTPVCLHLSVNIILSHLMFCSVPGTGTVLNSRHSDGVHSSPPAWSRIVVGALYMYLSTCATVSPQGQTDALLVLMVLCGISWYCPPPSDHETHKQACPNSMTCHSSSSRSRSRTDSAAPMVLCVRRAGPVPDASPSSRHKREWKTVENIETDVENIEHKT